jgi:hypothetical protein
MGGGTVMSRTLALAAILLAATPINAQQPGRIAAQAQRQSAAPTYQRRSTTWSDGYHTGNWQRRAHHDSTPPTHAGHPHTAGHAPQQTYYRSSGYSFQRPYPYHLDYYRMKYGGSYAPYFGNLYGPPNVYAPTQIGDGGYGPYVQPGYGVQAGYGPPSGYVDPAYAVPPQEYGHPVFIEQAPTVTTAPTTPASPPTTIDPSPADD